MGLPLLGCWVAGDVVFIAEIAPVGAKQSIMPYLAIGGGLVCRPPSGIRPLLFAQNVLPLIGEFVCVIPSELPLALVFLAKRSGILTRGHCHAFALFLP